MRVQRGDKGTDSPCGVGVRGNSAKRKITIFLREDENSEGDVHREQQHKREEEEGSAGMLRLPSGLEEAEVEEAFAFTPRRFKRSRSDDLLHQRQQVAHLASAFDHKCIKMRI